MSYFHWDGEDLLNRQKRVRIKQPGRLPELPGLSR